RRVLFWGVFGAVALRAAFILLGTELLSRFHWMFYIFGGFLVVSGLRMLRGNDEVADLSHSPILRFAKSHLRTSPDCSDSRFFRRINGVLHVTPLFLVLLVVEFSDLVFAVDSVPAVLGITVDLYVVYTSNIMAILGLRALYFLLHGMMDRFHKLDWALSAVLVFVGMKMVSHDFLHVSHWLSLSIIVGLLGAGVGASLVLPPPLDAPPSDPERDRSSPS
ncbi:MAG TPA: TerC/Alx family metal homeostasis membrane protein, partial [Polyangiaceae bacterium]|nr:TerC/Alx family metal homeostasis membrane protein [Polyangiaceae bacterium]